MVALTIPENIPVTNRGSHNKHPFRTSQTLVFIKKYVLCREGVVILFLKHTTTLVCLSSHDILSREWRVIVDQVQTNYHGRPVVL